MVGPDVSLTDLAAKLGVIPATGDADQRLIALRNYTRRIGVDWSADTIGSHLAFLERVGLKPTPEPTSKVNLGALGCNSPLMPGIKYGAINQLDATIDALAGIRGMLAPADGDLYDLSCECGMTAMLGDEPVFAEYTHYELAQYPDKDPTSHEHQVFDRITVKRDEEGRFWHEFNGGAMPVCGDCFAEGVADGQFRPHHLESCTYEECRNLWFSIAAGRR